MLVLQSPNYFTMVVTAPLIVLYGLHSLTFIHRMLNYMLNWVQLVIFSLKWDLDFLCNILVSPPPIIITHIHLLLKHISVLFPLYQLFINEFLDAVCLLSESGRSLVDSVLPTINPFSAMIIVVMCSADGCGRPWFTNSLYPWVLGSRVYHCLDWAMQPVYPDVCLLVFRFAFPLSDLPVDSRFCNLAPSYGLPYYFDCLYLSLSFHDFQLFLWLLPCPFFCLFI